MNNISVSDDIISERLTKSTRKNYGNKIKHFISWIKELYPEHCEADDPDQPILPIPTEILKEFYGHISRKKNKNGEYIMPTQWHAYQTVSGYKSAIKDIYKDNKVAFGADAEAMSNEFFQGYQRRIATLKQSGEMSLVEGKRPISFEGYKYLAKKAQSQNGDYTQASFAHTFLVFCWNLIARSISVGNLMYCHITWQQDSLIIHIPTHKGSILL